MKKKVPAFTKGKPTLKQILATDLKVPIIEEDRPAFVVAACMVQLLIIPQNHPFSISVRRYLEPQKTYVPLNDLIQKWRDTPKDEPLMMKAGEMYLYFIVNDLIKRTYALKPYVKIMNALHPENAESEYLPKYERASQAVLELANGVLEGKVNWKGVPKVKEYVQRAKFFPEPGVDKNALNDETIPKHAIPEAALTFRFRDYTDGEVYFFNMRMNANISMKDLGLMFALHFMLLHKRTFPAQILNAYFPNLSTELRDVFGKAVTAKEESLMTTISQAELGVLYVCSDIFKRLGASPYRTIFSQIQKELPAETLKGIPLPIIFSSVYTAFLPNVQDRNFKDIKAVLSDIPVIKAYHEYVKDFTWFDDLPLKS